MSDLAITTIIFLYLLFALGIAQLIWELLADEHGFTKLTAAFVGIVWPVFLGFSGVLAVYNIAESFIKRYKGKEKQ